MSADADVAIEGFTLSPQQKRLWRTHPRQGQARLQGAFLIEGNLDPELLKLALDQVVRRHEILRTTFRSIPGLSLPVQVVQEEAVIPLRPVDAQKLRGLAEQEIVEHILESEGHLGFDLENGPLLRAALWHTCADRHLVFLTSSALCGDRIGLKNLASEIASTYTALHRGGDPDCGEALQYADIADWLSAQLEEPGNEAGKIFWQGRHAHVAPSAVPALERTPLLPPNLQAQAVRSVLGEDLRAELEKVAAARETSLDSLLLAGWLCLLRRSLETGEVLIGLILDGRKYAELQAALGPLATCVPLHVSFEEGISFEALLNRVHRLAEDAYEWQEFVLGESLVADAEARRFPVCFESTHATFEPALGPAQISLLHTSSDAEASGLKLACSLTAHDVLLDLWYSPALFSRKAADLLASRFLRLLESVRQDPRAACDTLEILPAAERSQLLGVAPAPPPESRIEELFDRWVELTPEQTAVVSADEAVTYGELAERSFRISDLLKARGIGPGTVVGLCLDRSPMMIEGMLGVLRAGAAYLALDPSYPKPRLEHMVRDSGVRLVLSRKALAESSFLGVEILDLDEIVEVATRGVRTDGRRGEADALCYIVYTSGSTGQPKGVTATHRNVASYLRYLADTYDLRPADRVLQMAPLSFDASVREIFGALTTGATLVLAAPGEERDPVTLRTRMIETGVTCLLSIVPSMLRRLGEGNGSSASGEVRCILSSGEVLHATDVHITHRVFGDSAQVVNQYGPTECTMTSSFYRADPAQDLGALLIGRPIPSAQILILDDVLRLVPTGMRGDLYIGGAGLSWGYLGRPELAALSFVPHPFSPTPGARLYRTGDQARYLPDGNLELFGRVDHQLKIRGNRVEPGEVEAVLRTHPAVREAVAVGLEDATGEPRLASYIVAGPTGVSQPEILRHLRDRLPPYMIPAEIVLLESLPRTPNGKVDRAALPDPASVAGVSGSNVLPRTPVEEVLSAIWSEVLRRTDFGTEDDFFALGGHSLMATQVMVRIKESFRVEIRLEEIFREPTVARLAHKVDEALKAREGLVAPLILPRSLGKDLPLSFAQQRLWFLAQFDPESSVYNLPRALRLDGALDVRALTASLSEIARRHASLRTTFQARQGIPVQVIASPAPWPLPLVDLSSLDAGCRSSEAVRLAEDEARSPFDLSEGPLWRTALLRLEPEAHVGLFTMHHIISDRWSMGLLVRELSVLYGAIVQRRSSGLPEPAIQYADFACWQREWLQGETLEAELRYWRQRLGGELPRLGLIKGDRAAASTAGDYQSFRMPDGIPADLEALSRQEGATLFMALLAALKTLLFRITGQEDVLVGTDIANRNQKETEEIIGFFVNLLVLRSDLSGRPTFRQLLGRVREVCLGAYTHQDLPFEKLVEELSPDRHRSPVPPFEILFVLQNVPRNDLEIPGLTLSPFAATHGISRFDLALVLEQRGDQMVGSWTYKTDLFDRTTISRISGQFTALLESIVKNPDSRLHELELFTDSERKGQAMEQAKRETTSFSKFKAVKPKAVGIIGEEFVKTTFLAQQGKLPIVLQPGVRDFDIAEWARQNTHRINEHLQRYGAILFRGFGLSSVADFEQVAEAICPSLFPDYGDLPREGQGGKVYTSTPYPMDKTILFHNESSHMHQWPLRQFFFCVKAAESGGETPIVDCRDLSKALPPDILEIFENKGLLYVRNFTPDLDVSWQSFFGTTEKAEVEAYCREAEIELEWKGENGLRIKQQGPAVTRHPRTGERLFFNQIQIFHPATLDREVRESLLTLFGEQGLPRNVYYGDGTVIPDDVMQAVNEAYWSNSVEFRWQEGDMLALDNMLVAHARRPFSGTRKISVAMGEIFCKKDLAVFSN